MLLTEHGHISPRPKVSEAVSQEAPAARDTHPCGRAAQTLVERQRLMMKHPAWCARTEGPDEVHESAPLFASEEEDFIAVKVQRVQAEEGDDFSTVGVDDAAGWGGGAVRPVA